MAINKTGPVTVPMDSHPHAGAAVARDPPRLMPNLDITVILMDLTVTTTDLMDIPMLSDIVLMDLPLPLSPTEVSKVLASRSAISQMLCDCFLDESNLLMK